MDRMAVVFVLALGLAVVCSLLWPADQSSNRIQTANVRFGTSASFNIAATGVALVLIALYSVWW